MAFFEKIKQGLARTRENLSAQLNSLIADFTGENEEFFDELEEALILADVGVETATDAVEQLKLEVYNKGLRGGEAVKRALIDILTRRLELGDAALKLDTKPSVILMVGVNGVGKTTTIGKLAARYSGEGRRVLLCAGDTFRAAAAEQLTIWAQRAGCDIVSHEAGSDPAAVVFDSVSAAKARGAELIICDTAGRLHNKANLMNELSKIGRVISRELPDADCERLLVIDATTGQNGLEQARQFKDAAGITGIVLTKLDGTARGGIVFAIAAELGVPVKLVGVGEKADDLMPFEARQFAEALLS